MPQRLPSLLALVLAVAFLAFVPRFAFSDDVDTLFQAGNAALKKADYPTAYEKLSKAWELRQSVDIAANLAQAEAKLGKTREAAEHLAYAIAFFPPSGSDSARQAMQERLAELKKAFAEVTFNVEPGATIMVDDKTVGVAPLQVPVYLEPGKHVFAATKEGRQGSQTLHFRAGDVLVVAVLLKEAPAASASASASAAPSAAPSASGSATAPPPPEGPPKWPGFVVGGVGLVAIGIGGGLMGAGAGAKGDAEDAGRALPSPCNPDAPSTGCQDITDKLDQSNTLHNAGLGTLIGGSVVLATGVALIVWSFVAEPSQPDEARLQLLPLATPESQGLWLTGRF